ncbi:MAG: phosphatidate cytidylyltransferase [Chloroflexota bacterium]
MQCDRPTAYVACLAKDWPRRYPRKQGGLALDPIELTILWIIASLFLFGALIIWLASLVLDDSSKVRALWTTYATEFVIVGLVLVPAFVGGVFFAGVMALLSLGALWEFYGLGGDQFPLLFKIVGAIAGSAIFVSAYWFDSATPMLAIVPIATTVLLSINSFMPVSAAMPKHLSLALLGIIYPCLFLAHLILIEKVPNGFIAIFFMYAIVETHDSFALLMGQLFGRRKIFPQLSPKKTYEGSFFGILSALLMAVLLGWFVTGWSLLHSIGAALLIVLFTLFGDLAASKLKRDAGVKDFGNVLPRQGGILDIYDSLIFASPMFYLYLLLTAHS